jgi:hypothetical protein
LRWLARRLNAGAKSADRFALAGKSAGGAVPVGAGVPAPIGVDAGDEQSVRDFFSGASGSFDHLAMIIKAALPHDTFPEQRPETPCVAAFETKFWGQYRLARPRRGNGYDPTVRWCSLRASASRRGHPRHVRGQCDETPRTEALARVLAVGNSRRFRVNTVIARAGRRPGRSIRRSPKRFAKSWCSTCRWARLGGAAEIAEAYLYLFRQCLHYRQRGWWSTAASPC